MPTNYHFYVVIVNCLDNYDLIYWTAFNFIIDNYYYNLISGFCVIFEKNSTIIFENNVITGNLFFFNHKKCLILSKKGSNIVISEMSFINHIGGLGLILNGTVIMNNNTAS